MAPLYIGAALLILAIILFAAGASLQAAICCGIGGVWMGSLLGDDS